jgi:hypothetical protein
VTRRRIELLAELRRRSVLERAESLAQVTASRVAGERDHSVAVENQEATRSALSGVVAVEAERLAAGASRVADLARAHAFERSAGERLQRETRALGAAEERVRRSIDLEAQARKALADSHAAAESAEGLAVRRRITEQAVAARRADAIADEDAISAKRRRPRSR